MADPEHPPFEGLNATRGSGRSLSLVRPTPPPREVFAKLLLSHDAPTASRSTVRRMLRKW